LLFFIIVFGDIVVDIPMPVLVGIMIMVAMTTFSWSSFTFLKQAPKSESVVMIVTVAVILYTSNLAIGVVIGVILSTFIFVANISRVHNELIDGRYKVKGPLFFAIKSYFIKKLEIASESEVLIDFEDSQIWDESAVGAMLKV